MLTQTARTFGPTPAQRRGGVRPRTNSPGVCHLATLFRVLLLERLRLPFPCSGCGAQLDPRRIHRAGCTRSGWCENGLPLWNACSLACSVKLVLVCGSTRSCVTRMWGGSVSCPTHRSAGSRPPMFRVVATRRGCHSAQCIGGVLWRTATWRSRHRRSNPAPGTSNLWPKSNWPTRSAP